MRKFPIKVKNPDALFFGLFVAGVLSLTFLAGGVVAYLKLPPYELVDNAVRALKAEKERNTLIESALRGSSIVKGEPQVIKKPGAFKGYTFYTTTPTPKYTRAFLVDMDGNAVHEWGLPYSKFPARVTSRKRLPDGLVYWYDARIFPNGDLLGVYNGTGDSPYGYGLVKLDKDSNVIWAYGEHVNHRIGVEEDGTIITLIHDITSPPKYNEIQFVNKSIFSDSVTLLTPDGKEFKRISLLDALANSKYRSLLQQRASKKIIKGDVLHPNSVMGLPTSMAAAFPMFKPGYILISMRNPNLLGVLDPQQGIFVWCATGGWRQQHYAQFAPDGNIMLFDNKGGPKRATRILKVNPATGKEEVVFQGSAGTPFSSKYVGMQQELPNGNLLITETGRGRIFEINKDKEIVWQFIDPYHRAHKKHPLQIETGIRYAPEELTFLDSGTEP